MGFHTFIAVSYAYASASAAQWRCHSSAAGAQALLRTLVSAMLSHITGLKAGAEDAMKTAQLVHGFRPEPWKKEFWSGPRSGVP